MKSINPFLRSSLLFWGLMFCSTIFAQQETKDSAQVYQIIKNDNSSYVGIILSDDGREVLIQTENLGNIYIQKSEIKSIKKFDQNTEIMHGEATISNSFSTRYSFTTNALPIKKGENYSMLNLYGPEVHFALTDHFSLGVMSTWIASPAVLAAKYSHETGNENVNFSVGALLGTSSYIYNFKGYGGLLFANITLGNREKNITISGGYGYLQLPDKYFKSKEGVFETVDGMLQENFRYYGYKEPIKGPIMSVAGIYKVGAKASLVLDAMLGYFSQEKVISQFVETKAPIYNPTYIPGEYRYTNTKQTNHYTALFIMPGMRFQTTDRKAFQVSLAGVTMTDKQTNRDKKDQYSFPLPMVTWFRNF